MTWSTSNAVDVTKMTDADLDKQMRHVASLLKTAPEGERVRMRAWEERLRDERFRRRTTPATPEKKQRELTTPLDLIAKGEDPTKPRRR